MAPLTMGQRIGYLTGGAGRRAVRAAKHGLLRYYLRRRRRLPDTFGLRNSYFYPMHAKANHSYLPKPYPGGLVIFSRKGGVQLHQDTWGALAADGCEIHEIEGDHHDLMREPHVTVIAELLQIHLDRAVT